MNVLSLFSGCGGMDIGFEGEFICLKKSININMHKSWIKEDFGDWILLKETGFKTIFANDIRQDAKISWVNYFKSKKNNANEIYYLESIVDLVKKYRDGKFKFPQNVDIITGGFPCQDFSVAGKRKGFNSEKSHNGKKTSIEEPTIENRGNLYMWMREVVSIVKPKMFVAENVKGLISLEDAKKIIEYDFSTAADGGYLVIPAKVLHAADYGVPQSRERIIFYGFRKNALTDEALFQLSNEVITAEYNPYPIPTHNYNTKKSDLMNFVTCEDAFIDLEEPNISNDFSQQSYSKAKYLPKGQGNVEIKLNKISPTIRSEHHGNIEFRRLSLENGGSNYKELEKGMIQRRLTVRECARLQTFPDNYQFVISKSKNNIGVSASSAYKLIGNAVPCVLAYNIAMNLSNKWNKYFK